MVPLPYAVEASPCSAAGQQFVAPYWPRKLSICEIIIKKPFRSSMLGTNRRGHLPSGNLKVWLKSSFKWDQMGSFIVATAAWRETHHGLSYSCLILRSQQSWPFCWLPINPCSWRISRYTRPIGRWMRECKHKLTPIFDFDD